MPTIQIQPFLGTIPKLSRNLLPDGGATVANNAKMQSGEIRPWKRAALLSDVIVAGAATLYKLYQNAVVGKMLSWTVDVDVVQSPLLDTTDRRIYYTGQATPRKTNYALAISGSGPYPFDYLEMGVPAPTIVPTITVTTNGTGTAETRAYLVTYVSTFGIIKEESAPIICQVSGGATAVVVNPVGASVTLTGIPAAPTGKYNITHKRIYRTNVGTTDFGLLAEIPIATNSYVDSAPTGIITIILGTALFTPPPSDLIGIVSMPNGMLAGFRKSTNEVWFCEPYQPHAWPAKYSQTVSGNIIGLSVYGSSLVVMTDQVPYIMSGVHPSGITSETVSINEPCISKLSIASDENGVMYASPNGMVGIGPSLRGLMTEDTFYSDDWQKIQPSTLKGAIYHNEYIAFKTLLPASQRNAIVLKRNSPIGVTSLVFPALAFYVDKSTGYAYAASELDNSLYQLDGDSVNNADYQWNSKLYAIPQKVNFSFFQMQADYVYMQDTVAINAAAQAIMAQNLLIAASGITGAFNTQLFNANTFNGTNLLPVPQAASLRYINMTIYADGQLVHNASVISEEEYRLPSGYKAYNWEVQITGNVPIKKFAMATSLQELKQV